MKEGRCHPRNTRIYMRNEFRISTSTWLAFFGLGFLIGLFIVRRRNRQAARRYLGPVPPIIPREMPAPPPILRGRRPAVMPGPPHQAAQPSNAGFCPPHHHGPPHELGAARLPYRYSIGRRYDHCLEKVRTLMAGISVRPISLPRDGTNDQHTSSCQKTAGATPPSRPRLRTG